MAKFLFEVYVPTAVGADAEGLARRARAAADHLSSEGRPVRFLQSILIEEDETCFLLFEAASPEDVRQAAARADLPPGRISRADIDEACDAGRTTT
jgi:hypothetical protein